MAFTAISKLDPVSRNRVWQEHVHKESRTLQLSDTFMISDPDRMTLLPDKPNQVQPQQLLAPQGLEQASATLAAVTAGSRASSQLPPPERFELPPTANSEYGFFSHNNVSAGWLSGQRAAAACGARDPVGN
jgi:hypothetical protein